MELLKSTNYHLINFNFRSEVPATNEISVRGGEGKRQKEFVKLLWKFKVILEEALTEDIWKGEERVDFKAAMQKEWDMNRSSLRMKQVSRAFDQVSIDSLKGAIVKWMALHEAGFWDEMRITMLWEISARKTVCVWYFRENVCKDWFWWQSCSNGYVRCWMNVHALNTGWWW